MGRTSVNYRKTLAKKLADLNSSCYVLDAGTGAGTMTEALSDGLNASIVSVDLNRRVFPYVYEKVDRERVDFVSCDFANLPFKDRTFSGIVCDLVISTSSDWNPDQILKEFKRTLKANCRLYVTDYYPEETPRSEQDKLAAETWKLYREVLELKGKPRIYFPPKLSVQALENVGFHNVKCNRIVANEELGWKKRVFEEYHQGMENQISTLTDRELQKSLRKKLEDIRKEIIVNGEPKNWGWGANYMIHASK